MKGMNANEAETLAKVITTAAKLTSTGQRDLLLLAQGIEIGEKLRNNAALAKKEEEKHNERANAN